jgi:hypothetical protein
VTDDELKRLFEELRKDNLTTRVELTAAIEATHVELDSLKKSVATREALDSLRNIVATRDELTAALEATHAEINSLKENVATREALDTLKENVATRDELTEALGALRRENVAMHEETRRHFDVTTERIEGRFSLLAESVQHIDMKLDRKVAELSERIDTSAAETQAMIQFSHRQLDRRITTLEQT